MLGGPVIVHVDDVHEQEVVRVEYADGRHTSIHERFLLDTPRMFSFWNRWDAGMISLKHGHQGDHVVFVLDGEVTVGDVLCRKGSHIFLMHGDRFGPWVAGPQGCELLGIIAGDSSAFWSDKDMTDYQAMLTQADAHMAPVPPLAERPPWHAKGNPLPSRALED